MRFPSSDPQPEASTSVPLDPAPRPPLDVRVLRVSQIDAGRLDAELTSLLREQLLRVFARVHPGAVARRTPNSPSASTCSCSTSPCGLTAPPPAWS